MASEEGTTQQLNYVDPWDRKQLLWRPIGDRDGVLVRPDGSGYPVCNGVARFVGGRDPADDWVFDRAGVAPATSGETQSPESVESFGFEWSWDNTPRTEEDLLWRVAERFELTPQVFAGKRVLDAGCGAGAQSGFLARAGAEVSAVDLSCAVQMAARLPELRKSRLARADIAHLPFPNSAFDIVYCEGVLQHTAAMEPVLAEFARVLATGGRLLATHYLKPRGTLRTIRWTLNECVRAGAQRLPRDWLFLASGLTAAVALTPGVGWLLRKTIAPSNPRMRTLKATWSTVYDSYGHHHFQRYLPHDQFVRAIGAAGFDLLESPDDGVVRALRAS